MADEFASPHLSLYLCPINGCEWRHQERFVSDASRVETALRDHLAEHPATDYLRTIRALRAEVARLSAEPDEAAIERATEAIENCMPGQSWINGCLLVKPRTAARAAIRAMRGEGD